MNNEGEECKTGCVKAWEIAGGRVNEEGEGG
jgi:hypothetical protein